MPRAALPLALALAALPISLAEVAGGEACPTVTTQPGFDLDSFISKRWYIQQQMSVLYLPASQNFCVYAEYTKLAKPTLWGYSIQVHNYAQSADGTVHDSKKIICAKGADTQDPAKLEVGLCALPIIGGITVGPYWVLAYNEAEGYALVSGGQPTAQSSGGCRTGSGVNGAGLWIFTRAQERNKALVQKVRGIASSKGFDLSVLNDVNQTHCPSARSFEITV
uniref:Apolipoprotein D n=1 Tax=Alexandrium andersonii TaxID=327968 RepID=A0A7S2HMZ0_9DINO